MPIYEYNCMDCSEKFSVLQNITCGINETKCPKCASGRVKKLISSFCCSSAAGSDTSSPIPPGGFGGGG